MEERNRERERKKTASEWKKEGKVSSNCMIRMLLLLLTVDVWTFGFVSCGWVGFFAAVCATR